MRRTLSVRHVETLSPRVRSVTLGGDELVDFVSLSFVDHIKIFLPGVDGAPAVARDSDETALPAMARRLAELPVGATVCAIVQMPEVADRRALASAADLQLQWVSDAEQGLAAVRAWRHPAGEGFAWCAGVAALRRVLVDELGLDRHAVRAAAYWKRDAVAFYENLSD